MLSDAQLAQRLQNLATDRDLSNDPIASKWMRQAAARLLELSAIVKNDRVWHPSLTAATQFEKSYKEIVDWIVKNPFEDIQ